MRALDYAVTAIIVCLLAIAAAHYIAEKIGDSFNQSAMMIERAGQ